MKAAMLTFFGLMAAAVASPASAAGSDGQFAVKGLGIAPCSQFIEARVAEGQELSRYLGWLEGYFTATNRYEPDTFDMMPWGPTAMLELVVANHCVSNPDDRFVVAAQLSVEALRKARLVSRSDSVSAGTDEQEVVVYGTILRRAQVELAARGFYEGEPDGAYGPATYKALTSFQTDVGLDVTGLPDPSTVWLLLRPLGDPPN